MSEPQDTQQFGADPFGLDRPGTRPTEPEPSRSGARPESEPDVPAAQPVPAQAPTDRRRPRPVTMLLGLVMLVVAGCVLLAQVVDVHVNPGAVVVALLIGGGLLLIAGTRRS